MVVGIPFFLAAGLCPAQMPLALELMQEGNWPGTVRECRRVLVEQPSNEVARLIECVALARIETTSPASIAVFEAAAVNARIPPALRLTAACEAGCAHAERGEAAAAYRWLKTAFEGSRSGDVFLRSGAALDELLAADPHVADDDPSLPLQLATCAPALQSAEGSSVTFAKPRRRSGLLAKPGEWIVAFYSRAVAPAIGSRCSLVPSCSQYFLQASRERGLLAFPVIADRLVREPGVVSRAQKPAPYGETIRYEDPLSDHYPWTRGCD